MQKITSEKFDNLNKGMFFNIIETSRKMLKITVLVEFSTLELPKDHQ